MKRAVGAFTVPTHFFGFWKKHSAVHTTLSVEGSTQMTARMQPRSGISVPDANLASTNQICAQGLEHRHLSAHSHHFQKGHSLGVTTFIVWKELSLHPLKNTFLEDISERKDKNLPETSKRYFKRTHPLFHTRGRDNLQHRSSNTALLIISLTARLGLSNGTAWSLLYIPPKQQELAERDKQLHDPSALTQNYGKNVSGWTCCAMMLSLKGQTRGPQE